jgi:hypothetical protein
MCSCRTADHNWFQVVAHENASTLLACSQCNASDGLVMHCMYVHHPIDASEIARQAHVVVYSSAY